MILVTGGSGFLGKAIVDSFEDEAISLSRTMPPKPSGKHVAFDLTQTDRVEQLLEKLQTYSIGHIIHAAAITPWSQPADYTQDIQMAETVATLANRLKIREVYFLSGWIVYDMSGPAPYNEATHLGPLTDYGRSKLDVEEYFKRSLHTSKLINLRVASVFGPGQVSAGLIPNFAKQALTGKTLSVGSIKTKRDYLYIDDLTSALQHLITLQLPNSMDLNIGSGSSVSVQTVAETIQAICADLQKPSIAIRREDTLNEAKPLNNCLDIKKAQSLGLLKTTTTLHNGLEKYIQWVAKI